MKKEKIEDIVSALLEGVPNFIETDFIENDDNTYTLMANFEHPKGDEDYCPVDFIFAKVSFNENLDIIESKIIKTWKEKN